MKKLATMIYGCPGSRRLAVGTPAFAQLTLTITQGVTDPIPIAVVPFARAVPADGGLDVAAVVQRDLESSGRFKGMPRTDMVTTPTTRRRGRCRGLEAAAQRLRRGRPSSRRSRDGDTRIDAELVNVLTGQRISGQKWTVKPANLRNAAHRVADAIYEKIIGVRGAFATRIAYVSVDGKPPKQHYQLIVADADGENPRVILQSDRPIMSPAWSPDGRMAGLCVVRTARLGRVRAAPVAPASARMVSARAGINGAPVVVARRQEARAHAVGQQRQSRHLSTRSRHAAAHAAHRRSGHRHRGRRSRPMAPRSTSPRIAPAARRSTALAPAAGERPKRITFTGSYNARPRVSPDGKQLAVLTLDQGAYRIGMQDLANGTMRVLSKGRQDESPSFAPNGAMLIFAGANAARVCCRRFPSMGRPRHGSMPTRAKCASPCGDRSSS